MTSNPKPSSVNSVSDGKLMYEWNKKFKEILNRPAHVNSSSDAALYTGLQDNITSTPSFKINSEGDAKLFQYQVALRDSYFKCKSYNEKVVVAREGIKPLNRFGATITVYSGGAKVRSFVGSTLPDDPTYIDINGEPSVAVDAGIYKINKADDLKEGAPFYRVSPLDDNWYLPSRNLHPDNYNEFYHATGILIHVAYDNRNSKWSTGCITIEGVDNMDDFAILVGSSATLVIERP